MSRLIILGIIIGLVLAQEPAAPPRPIADHATYLQQRFAQKAGVVAKASVGVDTSAFLASLVQAHGEEKLADTNALSVYTRFTAQNPEFVQHMTKLFNDFDRNHDQKIDFAEIDQAQKDGLFSGKNCAIVRSWDVDHDGCVSLREFALGPLYLSLLENTSKEQHEKFHAQAAKADEPNNESQDDELAGFTALFSKIAKGEAEDASRFLQNEAGAENSEEAEAEDQEQEQEDENEDEEEEEGEQQGEAEQQSEEEQASGEFRFSTVEQGHGGRAEVSAEQQACATPGACGTFAKPGRRVIRPISKFGVPSFHDEGCVMCQFLVQRISRQLYYTLASSGDAYPADPNAEITSKKMKQINSQIMNRRGGKGLLRIIGEDIISDMCDPDTMPELFTPYCTRLQKRFPRILDGVFFQFNSDEICQDTQFCSDRTYFNRETSVHLPKESRVLNSGRGKCGMLGGAHERPNKQFNRAICWAGAMSF